MLLKEKMALIIAVYLWISLPYFILQRFSLFPIITLKPGPLDRLIPFNDDTIWLYFSFYLLIPIAPLLMVNGPQLRRYAVGIGLIGLVSHLVFLLYPTAIVRPSVEGANWVYRLMVTIDRPLNAWPSLHASVAIFSVLSCEQPLGQNRRNWLWRGLLWLWVLAILYATLATKQHVLIDLVGGGLLAVVIYLIIISLTIKIARHFILC
jgi:membrane-associated phospholipid phosphatase